MGIIMDPSIITIITDTVCWQFRLAVKCDEQLGLLLTR